MTVLQPLTVLIVEDEGIIAMDIESTVEDEGHVVAGWARSADEALQLYDQSKPDIVLLDIQLLDDSSGIEVAKMLRERMGARYVFMTANPKLLDKNLAGGIGVIEKPFTQRRLAQVLRYLQESIFDPPPSIAHPAGLKLGPAYEVIWS